MAADKAVGSTASAPPTVSSLNINFSDAGLFGMQVEAGKSEIRDVSPSLLLDYQLLVLSIKDKRTNFPTGVPSSLIVWAQYVDTVG